MSVSKFIKRFLLLVAIVLPFDWYWYASEAKDVPGARFYEGQITQASCHRNPRGLYKFAITLDGETKLYFDSRKLSCSVTGELEAKRASGYWKRVVKAVIPVEVTIGTQVVQSYSYSRRDNNLATFIGIHLPVIVWLVVLVLRWRFWPREGADKLTPKI